jgi:GTP-binding protein HflX
VLKDLGIDSARVIEVMNKIDRVAGDQLSVVGVHRPTDSRQPTTISALTGAGIDDLLESIKVRELKNGDIISLEIPHNDSRMIARLHEVAEVYEQRATEHAMLITAWVPFDALHLFDAYATNVRRARVS